MKSEEVTGERVKEGALSDEAAVNIAKTLLTLEERFGKPQDFEWAMEEGEKEGERESGRGRRTPRDISVSTVALFYQ